MEPDIKEYDRLTAHVTRTQAIASIVELNFDNGCNTYHTVKEETITSLLWQIKENLEQIKESSQRLYEEWRETMGGSSAL